MSYQKHVWVTNEIIRGKWLNHIEDGIYNEEHRALEAEGLLNTAIATERTRALQAESDITSKAYMTTDSALSSIDDADYVPFYDTSGSAKKKILWSKIKNALEGTFVKSTTYTSSSTYGIAKVDGTTITAEDGVITAQLPTVNDGKLTIQKNGTTVKTFTANQSSNVTANITVPTNVSELTNDSGYITDAGVTGVKGNSESTYRTGQVNITKSNIGLGSVGNFKAVSTVANQGLTADEKANARANIGAGSAEGAGTVTSITAGVGLAGGTISTTGTIKAKLRSETALTNDSAAGTETSGRVYPVAQDKSGYLAVNVPWSNDNTIPSAYCTTAADTAAKVASCSNYALLDKSYIQVIIKTANTSATALTLNINSKGAKAIYINGAASSTSNYTLPAGSYLVYYASSKYYFRTDGKITSPGMVDVAGNTTKYLRGDGTWQTPSGTTYDVVSSSANGLAPQVTNTSAFLKGDGTWATPTDTIPSAYCTTAAATAAKTASCSGYYLLSKSYIMVIISATNTAQEALTLNINGKGAKPIYLNGTVTSETNYSLTRGSYLVYYNGTNYYFRTDGKITGSITGNCDGKVNGYTVSKSVPSDAVFTDTRDFFIGTTAAGATANTLYFIRSS